MSTSRKPHLPEHLKANLKISDMKTRKILSQSRNRRSNSTIGKLDTKNKATAEKKVVNSFTHLIDSKNEDAFKNTLYYNVFLRNIKDHLIQEGRCSYNKDCDDTAKKLAAFVTDVMQETYRAQKLKRSNSATSKHDSKSSIKSASKAGTKESYTIIPGERLKSSRTSDTRLNRIALRSHKSDVKSDTKSDVKILKDSRAKYTHETNQRHISRPPSNEKEQINALLSDVDNRTKRWSEWIKDTVAKAESSKNRLKSGENISQVSADWKRFLKGKKRDAMHLAESSGESTDWQSEAFRKRGQESIQQWLLKNKVMNSKRKDSSDCSVGTYSNESLYSVWSSKAPSSIEAEESFMSKVRKVGMSPLKMKY